MDKDKAFREAFGARLKGLRKQHNLTQKELAAKLDISMNHLSKYETGVHLPPVEKLILLSEIFNTTMDYIAKGETTEHVTLRDTRLLERLKDLETVHPKDLESVVRLLDAVIIKNRVKGAVHAYPRK